MWNKRDTIKQVYVSHFHIGAALTQDFDPTNWSIVVFWSETSDSRPDVKPPVDISVDDFSPPDDNQPPQPPPQPPDQSMFDDPDVPLSKRSRSRSPPLPRERQDAAPDDNAPDDPPDQPPYFPPFQQTSGVRRERSRSREPHQDSLDSDQHPTIVPLEPDDADMPDTGLGGESSLDGRSRSPPPLENRPVRGSKSKYMAKPQGSVTSSQKSKQEEMKKIPVTPDSDDEDDKPNPTASSSSRPPLPISEDNQQEQEATSPTAPQDSDSDDSTDDTQRTIPYNDYQEDLFILEDGNHWNYLTRDAKILATTGSFTVPRDVDDRPIDCVNTTTLPITAHTLFIGTAFHAVGNRVSGCNRSDIEEDYSLITDDDKIQLTLCYKATAKAKGLSTAARAAQKRKEASTTEIRQRFKQFIEAKKAEYKSWVDNDVFDLVDMRKIKVKNFVTGRWVLTIKRDKDGKFLKCKARWVLRGFQDRQKNDQQTDSPAATRPGFRLCCQLAANNNWPLTHIDLKTAFLQGEAYDTNRDVICALPPESGLPAYMGARLKKPAYGMNDAPRKWWNVVDSKFASYELVPTRADRCCYVLYGHKNIPNVPKHKGPREWPESKEIEIIEQAMDFLLDPIAGSNAKDKCVLGFICLHVDDLFMAGTSYFKKSVIDSLRKDFQVGSEDTGDVQFVGQRIRWEQPIGKLSEHHIRVDQNLCVEELQEMVFDKSLKDETLCSPSLHTEYRSVLGVLNWLQSRTQYHIAYKFSRCASAAASPTIGDCRSINKVVRQLKNQCVTLKFWPLKGKVRIIGYPDASYRNNSDKSSQRGQCIFLAEPRSSTRVDSRGSLVDFESHKINRTTLSTIVSELYSFMKCYGTCQFLRGLWMDISGEEAEIHMRTDANNLVTTAQTTHLPEQKETIHLIQMLRKESVSGSIHDLAHVRTADMLSDCLTKHTANPEALIKAVDSGVLPNVDMHPPFRTLLKHKAYFAERCCHFLNNPLTISTVLGEQLATNIFSTYCSTQILCK
jgi:hypothetical protein